MTLGAIRFSVVGIEFNDMSCPSTTAALPAW